MPRGLVVERIPAPRADVFRLVHDYERRLEWDTLLRAAALTGSASRAGLHATAVCQGRCCLGGIEMRTEYVSFREPDVAAVKMVNRAAFFDSFAATIRHRDLRDIDLRESDLRDGDLGGGWSQVEYLYQFRARPVWLRWLLHPLMQAALRLETRRRLRGLRRFFESRSPALLRIDPSRSCD
jgi:Polyketide cyclase / dehydrase and lipid transport